MGLDGQQFIFSMHKLLYPFSPDVSGQHIRNMQTVLQRKYFFIIVILMAMADKDSQLFFR